MTDRWQSDLMLRYPQLFHGMGYPEVGDGWQDLIERAVARIATAVAGGPAGSIVRIVQIKEKYGTLRLYYEARKLPTKILAAVREAIDLAEARSACTCEECGAEGRLYDRGGWYLTRCANHAAGEPVPVRPGWENLLVRQTFEHGKLRVVICCRYDREHDKFVDAPLPVDFDETE